MPPKKTTAKTTAAKKSTAAKKTAPKKTTTKTTAKKSTTSKTVAKKTTTKTATKKASTTRKTVAKASTTRKTAPKKTAPKKVIAGLAEATAKKGILDTGVKLTTPKLKAEFQQYLAEFIGTGILTFAVTLNVSQGHTVLSTAVLASLVVAFLVYTLGGVSGANLNPAVTVALWINRNLSYKTAITYILAQVTGAMSAVLIFNKMGLANPGYLSGDFYTGIMEALGTALLVFGVLHVYNKKVHEAANGLVVGGGLLVGICLAATYTAGLLNPAISLSWNVLHLGYLAAPFAGSVVAVIFYRLLRS